MEGMGCSSAFCSAYYIHSHSFHGGTVSKKTKQNKQTNKTSYCVNRRLFNVPGKVME